MEGVKASKLRHTFGSVRSKSGYEAVKPRSSRDGSLIKANEYITAVQWATSGFGALGVLPTRDDDKENKISVRLTAPNFIEAHKSSIQDFDISPFDPYLILTSDGGTIKMWKVPVGGLKETMRESFCDIPDSKRISSLGFHPHVENLLYTCGKDYNLRFFDINNPKEMLTVKETHSDIIQSVSFDRFGILAATSCKDKQLRILDARNNKVNMSVEAHVGVKGFTATWLGKRDQILTSGFTKNGERMLSFWDMRSFKTAVSSTAIDNSPGMITPYYDQSTEMVFLLGRGDSTIRYYEITDDETNPVLYLDQYRGPDSQSDITPFPKRIVDVTACEVVRFAKLTKDKIEHLMFQIPRKETKDAKVFHEDLYRYVPSKEPSMNAKKWLKNGSEKIEPKLLTAEEMMPEGYQSIYDIDPNKKMEEERKEKEKDEIQNMTLEERKTRELKRTESIRTRTGTNVDNQEEEDDSSDDEQDDLILKIGQKSLPMFKSTSTNTVQDDNKSNQSDASNTSTKQKEIPQISNLPTLQALRSKSTSNSAIESPRQGKHKVTLEDGSTYDGQWKNDQKRGDGVFVHKLDGSTFDGVWVDDKRAGKGKLTCGSGSSKVHVNGSWISNMMDTSSAVFTLYDGSSVEFITTDEQGKVLSAKVIYKDGDVYEGDFNSSTGKRNGKGVWIGKDGSKYVGEYKEDLRHGAGEYSYPDGAIYKGSWKSDVPDGEGVYNDKTGQIITGTWTKGKLTAVK